MSPVEICVGPSASDGPIDLARVRADLPGWAELVDSNHDSSRCVAAFWLFDQEPRSGLRRFFIGAERRDETAIVLCVMAHGRPIRFEGEVSIQAVSLPHGIQPQRQFGLSTADKDLAVRICDDRTPVGWMDMQPMGLFTEFQHLVTDDIGLPLVTVRVKDSPRERWYFLPSTVR